MAQNKTCNDEDNWWRNNFSSRPYASGRNYEDFRPAYQYGFESVPTMSDTATTPATG